MKGFIIFMSIILIVIGIIPFLVDLGILPSTIPTSLVIYQIVMIVIGILLIAIVKRRTF